MIDLKKELEELDKKINSGKLSIDESFSELINVIANKIIELEERLIKIENDK